MDGDIIQLHELDNVGTAMRVIEANTTANIHSPKDNARLQVKDQILEGHKVALCQINQGEKVRKYGYVIGTATKNIFPGQHVHLHNLLSERGGVTNKDE